MAEFMFATGIENSYPTIAGPDGLPKRVDEMDRCGHYDRWWEDLGLVRDLGIEYLRYGPPYYLAHRGPDRYDWDFADETFGALKEMDITPIADLCPSASPTGSVGSTIPTGPGSSRTTPAPLRG